MKAIFRAATSLTLSLAFAPVAIAQGAPAVAASTADAGEIGGTLPDGTRWRVQMPAKWNGTLVLDLDGAGPSGPPRAPAAPPPGAASAPMPAAPPPNPFPAWLLSQGYAYGGITREPVGYDFPRAVDYLLDVRARAVARWGAARRTLVIGGSRGAFVVRKALELRPDVFDGGMMNSGGGAGEIAVLNNKLNTLFVLKTLVDPASPMRLVGVDPVADNAALQALVANANASPQGRARLALAGAVQQFALWSSRGKPRPAPTDYEAQVDQMAENFTWAAAVPVRAGVEKVAGGNVSWNTGVDYAALLRTSGRQAMVEALYAKAGLRLADDLATLAKAPRIAADPAAVRKAEPLMTYNGRIKDPVINIDNDDPVDPASDKLVYADTLKAAGTAPLFRLIWSDLPGHGGQSPLDRATAFTLLNERIASGKWGDTSVPALKKKALAVAAASPVDLGQATFFDPGRLPPPAGRWDFRNWGRYAPR